MKRPTSERELQRVARALVGKTIARVDLRIFDTDTGVGMTADPRIEFTDGSALVFTVAEVDSGETYGITPMLLPARKSHAKQMTRDELVKLCLEGKLEADIDGNMSLRDSGEAVRESKPSKRRRKS